MGKHPAYQKVRPAPQGHGNELRQPWEQEGSRTCASQRVRSAGEGAGETVLPTEIKTLPQCRERLLPSLGQPLHNPWSVSALLTNFFLSDAAQSLSLD